MDLITLKIMNPWWSDSAKIQEDPHLKNVLGRPFYFDNPIKNRISLAPGRTYILRGSRQVGKTTLLKEKIFEAIQVGGIEPRRCLYLSCEALEGFKELQQLLTGWIRSLKEGPLILCLDEITFVPEWQRALLWLINAGLLRGATTMITGSNARDLKKSAERFPGRHVIELRVFPLSVFDYEKVGALRPLSPSDRLELYFKIGGFPHAIRDFCEKGGVSDETYETYANWIFGDAHRFALNRETLNHMLFRIYETQGSQVTWQRLVEKSPVKSHETAAAYVEHLEQAFLCFVLPCYDPEKRMAAPRKAKKIYYLDPLLWAVTGGFLAGIRNTYVWWEKMAEDKDLRGKLFEATVVNTFKRTKEWLYYWYSPNSRGEVDLLIKHADDFSLYEIKSAPTTIRPVLGRDVSVITPELFIQGNLLQESAPKESKIAD